MANWQKELRRLSTRDPVVGIETQDISKALHDMESDHACALLGGSMAEVSLEQIIQLHLISTNRPIVDELFGYDSVLEGISSKIKIAYAFGLIDKIIRSDLDRIRHIRSFCRRTRRRSGLPSCHGPR